MFINKADIVDKEMLELVEIEMMELLNDFGFDGNNTPMVHGSALLALKGDQGEYGEPSIMRLIEALDRHVNLPTRDVSSPLLMPVDNIISVPGRGTVVIGTVKRGTVKKGDSVQVMGFGYNNSKATVSALQVFKKEVGSAQVSLLSITILFPFNSSSFPLHQAGDNIGMNIKGVKAGQLEKGMIVAAPGSFSPTNHFDVCFFSDES